MAPVSLSGEIHHAEPISPSKANKNDINNPSIKLGRVMRGKYWLCGWSERTITVRALTNRSPNTFKHFVRSKIIVLFNFCVRNQMVRSSLQGLRDNCIMLLVSWCICASSVMKSLCSYQFVEENRKMAEFYLV